MLIKFKPKSEFSHYVLTFMSRTTIAISIKAKKQYTNLIKSLSMFLYNSPNNAHHCICLQLQSVGFFYLGNK
jgi:hypothetical protein